MARAVEVGVFTGYSALATALACALPGSAGPVAWHCPLLDPMRLSCESLHAPQEVLHAERQDRQTCVSHMSPLSKAV